ncbi:GNAT family N-acetyltransferase [Legionella feeleii]|uniref:Acetyltransferase n=1 Tax=Legionella feeleii TaxID=453 RepID=A0A0W0U4Y4_9GAMM|nr:GNAT family N-acetyltransferase [Legionella feeleii]KTD02826.1 GNAT family acetyltransferase [Legionella feeleii]SPX59919.1 Acetyltransferase [Legionella feeleii]STX37362.1 Acetyltransferase [Legionella feeleii]
MNSINYIVDNSPNARDNSLLREKILEFNSRILNEQASQFSILAKNKQGDMIGGATVWEHSDALYIDILWVDEKYRKNRIGSHLINKVIEQALSKNILKIFVDTYEFQAEDFYIKQGFLVIGRLDNYLLGHDRIYLRKDLKPAL